MSGTALIRWRQRLGLTQAQAAHKLGRSRKSIQEYEAHRSPVPLVVAWAAAAIEAGLEPISESNHAVRDIQAASD